MVLSQRARRFFPKLVLVVLSWVVKPELYFQSRSQGSFSLLRLNMEFFLHFNISVVVSDNNLYLMTYCWYDFVKRCVCEKKLVKSQKVSGSQLLFCGSKVT